MHFGEYELFLSLISLSPLSSVHPKIFQHQLVRPCIPCYRNFSLSPLSSVHPKIFQHQLVRPSIPCYRNFSMTKDRSQSFASTPTNYTPFSDSLSLRLQLFKS